jgi:hypothetical protein
MLKCQAVIDLDLTKEIYTVTVSGDNGVTEKYLVPYIEAQDQVIHTDPESYAAMKGIRLFMEQYEEKDA